MLQCKNIIEKVLESIALMFSKNFFRIPTVSVTFSHQLFPENHHYTLSA